MRIASALAMAKMLVAERLKTASCVVDATAGNGFDTLFLARNTPLEAVVWSFDVQQIALDNTYKRLAGHNLAAKIRLIKDCHSNIPSHVFAPVDIAMFNLGYLPGGDHSLTTEANTVTAALNCLIPILADEGLISIVVYPGHLPGANEHKAIRDFTAHLPQDEFNAASWSMTNQINDPPVLYMIEKKRGGKHESFEAYED